MIYSSLAVLAMSASAAVPSLANLVHLHPRAARVDNRVALTLYNTAFSFRDVKIDGRSYTVLPNHLLDLHAPEGTRIYADSLTSRYRRGDILLEVTSGLQNQKIDLK